MKTRIEVQYVRSMYGAIKIRRFKTQAEFEKWFEKNEDAISNVKTRVVEV